MLSPVALRGGARADGARVDGVALRGLRRADDAYLLATWHPSTRPSALPLEPGLDWRRLEVVDVVGGGPFDSSGIVEFRAFYRSPSGRGSLHERSRFVRDDGRWFYVDAVAD